MGTMRLMVAGALLYNALFVAATSGGSDVLQRTASCAKALQESPAEKQELESAKERCVAEQGGLERIIAKLNEENQSEAEGMRGPLHSGLTGLLTSSLRSPTAVQILKCITKGRGLLLPDDSLDTAGLNARLQLRVTGSGLEDSVRMAIEQCGAINQYAVDEYLLCVIHRCAINSPVT
ncbi:uncharacterized protein LOC108681594 isoform X2 [Hyalella azteca]|uniref:Uncharacterized protein LOC108681594 isoform X2 n=1 Tax=Hyalella azteca TaxID=294128 RepID=A0A8B7PL63_HYAAZ|nr:uncharacterized protein LOC108681594 isoform X2 [Hyalella azteca]